MDLLINQEIGHYRIQELIGYGGMGRVYRAENLRLKQTVALKFLNYHPDEETKQRFIHEARTASSLDHQNICTIHDIDETDDGQLFISMACYEGQTLAELIKKGSMDITESLGIVKQIAEGLAAAHEHGIVHRDIKPANIIITNEGIIKILDFGLSKVVHNSVMLTKTGTTVGTVAYMSPEQASGREVDARTDIWSLGVILYEMLTGKRPFDGSYDQAVVYSIINEAPVSINKIRPDVQKELEWIVFKCLEKNPQARYANIRELISDLVLFAEKPGSSSRISAPRSILKKKPSGIALSVALIIIISAAVIMSKYWFFRTPVSRDPIPIAVISFENQTGDKSLDYLQKAIPNLLITSLEQSKYFRVATWERLRDLSQQVGLGEKEFYNSEDGIRLCQKDNVKYMAVGSFIKAGDIISTDLKVLDVNTREIVESAHTKGRGLSSILEAQIDKLSEDIRNRFSEVVDERARKPHNIIDVTTNSLEAYNYYLLAQRNMEIMKWQPAIQYLEKAIRIDSTFASAYALLGSCIAIIAKRAEASKAYAKAETLKSRMTEKERMFFEYLQNFPRYNILLRYTKLFPYEKSGWYHLGYCYQIAGKPDSAMIAHEKAIALDPDYGWSLNNAAYLYALKGNYDTAINYLKRYAAAYPGEANPYDSMGEVYFIMGDTANCRKSYLKAEKVDPSWNACYGLSYLSALQGDFERALKIIEKRFDNANTITSANQLIFQSLYLHLLGRTRLAMEKLTKAQDIVVNLGSDRGELGRIYRLQAYLLLETGQPEKGIPKFNEYAKLFNSDKAALINLEHYKGYCYLRMGKIDSVQIILNRLQQLNDEVPQNFRDESQIIINELKAGIKLKKSLPDSAYEISNRIMYPPVQGAIARYCLIPNLKYQLDLKAQISADEGRFEEAEKEYLKLLYPDLKTSRYLPKPVYHYFLGNLYYKAERKELALKQYKKFLEYWKKADSHPYKTDAENKLSFLFKNLN